MSESVKRKGVGQTVTRTLVVVMDLTVGEAQEFDRDFRLSDGRVEVISDLIQLYEDEIVKVELR